MYLKDRTRVVGLSFYKPSINILKRKLLLEAAIGCIDLLIKVHELELDRWYMIFSCVEFDFVFRNTIMINVLQEPEKWIQIHSNGLYAAQQAIIWWDGIVIENFCFVLLFFFH